MNTKWTKLAVVAVVFSTSASSRAAQIEYSIADPVVTSSATENTSQSVMMTDVLAGKIVPIIIKGKELSGSWRTFDTNAGLEEAIMTSIGLPDRRPYFSQGTQLLIGGESYIVAYRVRKPQMDSTRAGESIQQMALRYMKEMETLRPDTTLELSLINLRTAGNFKDIKKFDSLPLQAMATTFPVMPSAFAEESNNRLRTLMQSVLQYSEEEYEKFPVMNNFAIFKKQVGIFAGNDLLFVQPGTGQNYMTNPLLSQRWTGEFKSPLAALYEAKPASDGKRAVAFTNGVVRRVSAAEWTKIKKVSKIK